MQGNRCLSIHVRNVLFLLVGLLVAGPSLGQSSDSALAEALFKDARALMNAGKLDEACPKFAESQRLVPKLGTLLNLATCHDKQGKTGSAWDEYTQAVTLAKQAGEADRVTYARRELERIESRLSKLVIRVPRPVEGLEVTVDGRVIGRAAWGTPIPLDPGDHQIEAKAPGHEPWQKGVTMPKGPADVPVEIPALSAAEAAPTAAPSDEPPPPPKSTPPAPPASTDEETDAASAQSTAGWVLGAVGIVGIGVGTGFGINTFLDQGASDDHCTDTLCDQEGVDLRASAKTSAVISDVAFAVGAAALLTGIILLATDGGDEAPAEAGAEAARAWLTVGASARGAALGLGASF
jgi:hypothetical protein